MSYDLFFRGAKLTESEFSSYFAARPNYQMNPKQAYYENEDTGVHFSFEFGDDEDDPEAKRADASFNLNFFRPHFFALEAEPEVRAFIERFDLRISDPQAHGMGEGPYSTEGFLRGWNVGNEFGCRAILEMEKHPESIDTLPTAELESIWLWNRDRKENQRKVGDWVFVPRIMYLKFGTELCTVATWPDGMPTLLPVTDGLIIGRKQLARRRFFRRSLDTCYVPFDMARVLLSSHPMVSEYARPAFLLSYRFVPAEIIRFVKGLKPIDKLNGVHNAKVLNREMIEKAREKSEPR